jgi:hypothetical protein
LGLGNTAKLPLHKKNLTYDSLINLKERLEKVGYEKFMNSNGVVNQDEVPIQDYENTQYFATV